MVRTNPRAAHRCRNTALRSTIALITLLTASNVRAQGLPPEVRSLFSDLGNVVSIHQLVDKMTLYGSALEGVDRGLTTVGSMLIFRAPGADPTGEDIDVPLAISGSASAQLKTTLLGGWLELNAFAGGQYGEVNYPDNTCLKGAPGCSSEKSGVAVIPWGRVLLGGAGFAIGDYVSLQGGYAYTRYRLAPDRPDEIVAHAWFLRVGIPLIGLYTSFGNLDLTPIRNVTSLTPSHQQIERYVWPLLRMSESKLRLFWTPTLGIETTRREAYVPGLGGRYWHLHFADQFLLSLEIAKSLSRNPARRLPTTTLIGIPVKAHVGLSERFGSYYMSGIAGALAAGRFFFYLPIEVGQTFDYFSASGKLGWAVSLLARLDYRERARERGRKRDSHWTFTFGLRAGENDAETIWQYPALIDQLVAKIEIGLQYFW